MVKFLKIAHRGASGYEPENTIIAFQEAINMGADAIELDIHFSKDEEIIVIHDESIDRTTNGSGFINEMKLVEIKSFWINEKHKIPTLNEVLELANENLLINIELKSNKNIEKVIILIKKYFSVKNLGYQNFIISSFDWNILTAVKKIDKNIPIGVLTATDLSLAIEFAKKMSAKSIHPEFELLNHKNIVEMQKNNFQVYAWTVNKTADIQKIKALGVNGIISDFIDRI